MVLTVIKTRAVATGVYLKFLFGQLGRDVNEPEAEDINHSSTQHTTMRVEPNPSFMYIARLSIKYQTRESDAM